MSGGPSVFTMVFIREIQKTSDREKEIERCYIASFKDGGKGPQNKDYRSPIILIAGKVKNTGFKSLQDSWNLEETHPDNTLTVAQ